MVHCGECDHVYNAADYLYEELPAAREALSGRREETSWQQEPRGKRAVAEKVRPDLTSTPALHDDRESAMSALKPLGQPLFNTGWQQEGIAWKDVLNGVATGLLLVLLGFQWLFFNRAELSTDLHWRPSLERMCGLLGCELPLRADLSQIELLDRDVRQHPQVEGALLINATFSNRSPFAQPYPVFEISFSNLAGNAIAVRRFRPSEYLVAGVDIGAGITPNSPVRVMLEVEDPGEKAVSYQFGFL
jgi:hypothetical protein